MPPARVVPKGRDSRAAQIESRPNNVRYHGDPAPAKTSSGASGSRIVSWRRSSSALLTTTSRRVSAASTSTEDQSTRSAPGSASNAVAARRWVTTDTRTDLVWPGGTSRSKRMREGRSGSPASTAEGRGSVTTCVRCRSSDQVRTTSGVRAPAVIVGSSGPAGSPDLTAPREAPSPPISTTRRVRTVSAAREVRRMVSVIPASCTARTRRSSTVGSGPGVPRWRREVSTWVSGPTLEDITRSPAWSSASTLRWETTRRSSTKTPVPGAAIVPSRADSAVALP